MRQIARHGARANHSLLAILEQGIEVVHQRLDFAGIVALDAPLPPFAHPLEARAKLEQRRRDARPSLSGGPVPPGAGASRPQRADDFSSSSR